MLRVTSELLTWGRVETQPQNNLETLETQLAKVTSERDEYAQLARLLREELERVKRGLMGPSRERFVADGQLSLAVLATALEASTQAAPPNEEPAVVVPSHKRKKPTGRCIPENLPQVDIETVPEDVQRAGLDAFVRIGEDVTQQVERRAGGLVRVRTVRGKYVPKAKPFPGAWLDRVFWRKRWCAVGRTTCPSTAWSPSTRVRAGRFPAPPCVNGISNWQSCVSRW